MQPLIVISQAGALTGEARHINALFDAGLAVLHLRKPGCAEEQLHVLLRQIDPAFYDRIALHQHHRLAQQYGIRRLHYTEAERLKASGQEWNALVEEGHILSTSLHALTDYAQLPAVFAYALIGPFAPSLSKPGYGSHAQLNDVSSMARKETDRIAIGGIHAGNLREPLAAGYEGIALLGSIWKDENTTDNFKQLQALWHTTGPMY